MGGISLFERRKIDVLNRDNEAFSKKVYRHLKTDDMGWF